LFAFGVIEDEEVLDAIEVKGISGFNVHLLIVRQSGKDIEEKKFSDGQSVVKETSLRYHIDN